jgi:hypothetical protein
MPLTTESVGRAPDTDAASCLLASNGVDFKIAMNTDW